MSTSSNISSKVESNVIQGISQQDPIQRRDSQCEDQLNCFNSAKDGAVSRQGTRLTRIHKGANLAGAYFRDLLRGEDEHYHIAIAGTGALRVFNAQTGLECSLSVQPDVSLAYLNVPVGKEPRDCFVSQVVDDYTFIANKTVLPAMAATISPVRFKEALVFFKASGYVVRYVLTLVFNGGVYSWAYETPDNSVAANAQYIQTQQIAATFYRALTGNPASGYANPDGLGSLYAGSTNTTNSGGTLPAGFSVGITGNVLRIWRTDNQDFRITASDTAGDTMMSALKGTVKSIADLPRTSFAGVTFKVSPSKEDAADDYYVEYIAASDGGDGYWRERPAPGAKTTIDPNTMPLALVSTGPNAFELRRMSWSTRIAGDGVSTARDPYFIGRAIQDIVYTNSRLVFVTEPAADWSKARNPFTHFPDTVQSLLVDAPINITVSAPGVSALLRKAVVVDEGLYLCAQRAWFRIHSGNNQFKQDTIEAPVSAAYEFAERCNFEVVGKSLYYAKENGRWSLLTNVQFQNGRILGEVDVTDHVPALIPAGARRLSAHENGKTLFVQTDGAPRRLFVYNYLTQNNQLVQSAWHPWEFPLGTILHSSIRSDTLFLVVQRDDGVVFVTHSLDSEEEDDGGTYALRLDNRIDETMCSAGAYNEGDNTTEIALPYDVGPSERDAFRITQRLGVEGVSRRGSLAKLVSWPSADRVIVEGDYSAMPFFAGFAITTMRKESTFYLRTENGPVPADDITVREYVMRHSKSGYYRIEVGQGLGREKMYPLVPEPRTATSLEPPVYSGSLRAEVAMGNTECIITVINDSVLPSRWQTAEWRYTAVYRARPTQK